MKLELKDPHTGRQVEIELPDWKILTGMMGATASFRSLASVHVLGAMVANPSYHPQPQPGEDGAQACARRAVDYAEALEAELNHRQAAAAAERNENTP